MRGLLGAGHTASALDCVSDAADFREVFFGDGSLEKGNAAGEIGDDRGVDLADGGFGHHLAKLGEDLRVDDREG